MVFLRQAARSARCLRQPSPMTTLAAPISSTARSFSSTARRQGGHGPQYDPPTGWLWGVKPGEKSEPEGWEWPMALFCGGIVATAVALAFKPDTSVSTWALEEARRRLEAEGILPDPYPNSEAGQKKD